MADSGCSNSTCTNTPCPSCQPTCYSKQTFCAIGSQYVSGYYSHSWPNSFNTDDIIIEVLPRDVFNSAITFINNGLHKGSTKSTSSYSISKETRDFIYADKINDIVSGLSKLGQTVSTVNKNDIIYASYFNKLRSALNNAKLSSSACNTCNTGCNVQCDACEGCVSCEGCNTCQGYTTCHSPCHSPCHTPCDTPDTTT